MFLIRRRTQRDIIVNIHTALFKVTIIIIIIIIYYYYSVLLTECCAGGEIEKNEMGGACGEYGRGERGVHGSGGET